MKDDLTRYIVRDGYAYFVGDYSRKDNVKPAGTILTLTDEQVKLHKQRHKLAYCEAVLFRCNDCGEVSSTEVIQIQYAKCKHCGKRGGDLIGPVPLDGNLLGKDAPTPQDALEDASTPHETPDSGEGVPKPAAKPIKKARKGRFSRK